MNTTISNNGHPAFAPANGAGKAGGTPVKAESATTQATSGSVSQAPSDQLKLTDSARALHQAASTGDSPAIDPLRVERVRQSLANGSYKIDSARIADRMLTLDAQLGGTDKA
ncbi:MAG: flagellar biosynthesis anti-sigma factor FlgM [Rhodanobacter sp.]